MSENYILLVDDNEDDIDLTIRAIRKTNIDQSVVVARDGQEALDYLFAEGEYAGQQHELPSVVLLDLNTNEEKTYQIVGVDEADLKHGKISVTSPVARALIGKIEGDEVALEAPGGTHEFEILEIRYQ